MRYVYITSARSHPEINIKQTVNQQLQKYYLLDHKQCLYYISFTSIPKIGINPVNIYGTPIGIYAYPISLVKSRNGKYKIPYAKERPYIQVLKLVSDRILDSDNYSPGDYAKDMRQLERLYNKSPNKILDLSKMSEKALHGSDIIIRDLDKARLESWDDMLQATDILVERLQMATGNGSTEAQNIYIVWLCSQLLALLISSNKDYTVKWNRILRTLGYDVILDRGLGFVHPNEPVQAIFLVKSAFEHVDTIFNQKPSPKINKKISELFRDRVVEGDLILSKTNLTTLPNGLTINGNLDLRKSKLTELPTDLTVTGTVDFSKTKWTEIPSGWTVGSLDLNKSKITSIPEDLVVKEKLELSGNIRTLPSNYTVNGDLVIYNSFIFPDNLTITGSLFVHKLKNPLPDTLSVGKNINLSYAEATEFPNTLDNINGDLNLYQAADIQLPENLTVKGKLKLVFSQITKLPKGLDVGELDVFKARELYTLPQNLRVRSDLRLKDSNISQLSSNTIIDGNLDASFSGLFDLPENLVVHGDLNLTRTRVAEIPPDIIVDGRLIITDTKIATIPKTAKIGSIMNNAKR